MSERTYDPDLWSLVEITNAVGEKVLKVFGSWYGGYGGGDSWKLSSGVVNVTREGRAICFHNQSGSVYRCYKANYGMSGYSSNVYQHQVNEVNEHPELKASIRLLSADEALKFALGK